MSAKPKVGRRGALALLGLAAVAAVAVAAVVMARDGGGGGAGPAEAAEPIEATAVVSPSVALFGDTVTARVDVTLDRSRVDPDSVRIQAEFTPWKVVGSPERLRRDAETTTYLRTTFVLRCLETPCTSTRDTAVQDFDPARVTYAATGSSERRALQVRWPQLVVGSRYNADVARAAGASASRWRADLVSLPAVSYGPSPGALLALLLAGSTLLAIAAGALAHRAFPRSALPDAPVKAAPEPVLTPLERALALLEVSERVDGAGDQRRALEFIAELLDERGETRLAAKARALAWSKPVPAVDETSGVAARVRSTLGEDADA